MNLFVSCNGIAVVSQIMGLFMTMQLVVHMDRVPGACGAAAFLTYPNIIAGASVAYSLSFGVNMISTMVTLVVASVAMFDWEGLVAPGVFLAVTFSYYIFEMVLTWKAHDYADSVVEAAAKRYASVESEVDKDEGDTARNARPPRRLVG